MPADADDRYLASIAEDCHRILGPGMEIRELTWEGHGHARLTLRYVLDGWEGESIADGETVIEAHARLREQLVVDRVRLAFSAVLEPPPSATR